MGLANTLNTKGLTLVELMIVVSIILIITAIAIPSYFSDLPRQRLKGAATNLLIDMRMARSRAVASNQHYLVCFDNVSPGFGYTLVLENVASPMDCSAGALEKTVDFDLNYAGVVFGKGTSTVCGGFAGTDEPITFTAAKARFNRNGSAVDNTDTIGPGLIYLTNTRDTPDRAYCVHVEGTTGRAKLHRWDKEWK